MGSLGHKSDALAPQECGAVAPDAIHGADQKKAKRTKRRVSGKAASVNVPAKSYQQVETPLLDIKEAAAYLKMGVFMLRQRAGRDIPYVQYGGGTSPFLFLKSDLDKFIQAHRNDFTS
jgi:hypothetical protein